ncbi:MAG: hypothetical protein Q8O55_03140 [Dehalococcoidales bacterium]|nr:hypothetical protein [Dehalococcoidales bacterium]
MRYLLRFQKSPGCLRCHGKLVATTGEQKGKTLDASCDACHYVLEPEQEGDSF